MPLSVATASAAYMARPALAGNVADVHAHHAAGEREIIQVIATDEGGRLKFVGDRNTADAQRLSRQHAALNCPGFVQFLLS